MNIITNFGVYLHSVTHHGHLVQSWLTVEYNHVVINNVAFHNKTNLEVKLRELLVVAKVYALQWSVKDQLTKGPGHRCGSRIWRQDTHHAHGERVRSSCRC